MVILVCAEAILPASYLRKAKVEKESDETLNSKWAVLIRTERKQWINAQTVVKIPSIFEVKILANLLTFLLCAGYYAAP